MTSRSPPILHATWSHVGDLSERLGPLTYGEEEGEVFLGHSMSKRKDVSDETAHVIDEEIRNIVDRSYVIAKKILEEKMDRLHIMAEALLKFETITTEQIKDIMEGKTPREPSDWSDNSNAEKKKNADESVVHRNRDPVGDPGLEPRN